MDEKTCETKLETNMGTTEWEITCQLKSDHTGGHRVRLVNDTEDTVTILSWFKGSS